MGQPLGTLIVRHTEQHGKVTTTFRYPSARRAGDQSTYGVETLTRTRRDDDRLGNNAALVLAALDSQHRPPPPEAGMLTFGRLGAKLASDYLPERVSDWLFSATTPLGIDTDDLTFPWELLKHPSDHRGAALGMRRAIGRFPAEIAIRTAARAAESSSGAAIIGDSLGDRPFCAAAAAWIEEGLRGRGFATTLRIGKISRDDLIATLGVRQAILYYTGHLAEAEMNAVDGLAYDGGILRAAEFEAALTAAGLVYLGGCRSARRARPFSFGPGHGGRGLVGASFNRGAVAVVGTLWEVHSQGATVFDRAAFGLIQEGVPIGEALRRCRVRFAAARGIDPTWGAYILYGDPRHTLATIGDPARLATIDAPSNIPDPVIPPLQLDREYKQLWLSPRVAIFLYALDPAEPIAIAPDLRDGLDAALALVERQQQPRIHQIHLLAGLAEIPGGDLPRGLQTLGIAPGLIGRLATRLLRVGEEASLVPGATTAVASAFTRAQALAVRAGRPEITSGDLLSVLLEPPVRGSLRAALDILGTDGPTLLAALRGESVTLARPRLGGPRAIDETQAEADSTSQSALSELRPLLIEMARQGAPIIGRQEEARTVLRLLARTDRRHILLVGAPGVGKYTLALGIAGQIAAQDDPLRVGIFAGYALYILRHHHLGPRYADRIQRDLERLSGQAIVILDDLPSMAATAKAQTILSHLAAHPQIHLLATATATGHTHLIHTQPDLAGSFSVVPLAPPTGELARQQVAAHLSLLASEYKITFAPGAAEAAISAAAEAPLVLPGAALERLRWACVLARHAQNSESELPGGQVPAPPPLPIVTPADIRAATTVK